MWGCGVDSSVARSPPVMQSTKFEFVLNLKTAKTLELDVPMTIAMSAIGGKADISNRLSDVRF